MAGVMVRLPNAWCFVLILACTACPSLRRIPQCSYHQETGRGGRDGASAECVLFYSYADALKGRHMIATSAQENGTAPQVVEANLDALNAMVSEISINICGECAGSYIMYASWVCSWFWCWCGALFMLSTHGRHMIATSAQESGTAASRS